MIVKGLHRYQTENGLKYLALPELKTWKEVLATVAVGDVSLPPANPEQTQTEKAPHVGINLLGLVPLVKKLFKKKSVPLDTPTASSAAPESTPCAFNPVVFEIEVYDAAGTSLLETHEVRANGACTWHNVSKKLKFAEERYITVKTKFLDPACLRNAYYDNIRIRIMDIPEVLQQNHYYPFGMNMTGIEEDDKQTLSSLEENMYQYNGKERETSLDLHWYDYGARQYDVQLGRWNGVDPLAEKYFSYSPYNYVVNNPIIFIDPDGRSIWISTEDDDGNAVRLSYKEGKLYSLDGAEYQGQRKKNGKYKGELGRLHGDLNKLRSKDYGKELVDELADSEEKNVYIVPTEAGEGVVHKTKGDNWSYISFSKNVDYRKTMTEDGAQDIPSFLKLGHELGHAKDHLLKNGLNHEKIDKKHDATKAEYYGTYVENRIREEHDLLTLTPQTLNTLNYNTLIF